MARIPCPLCEFPLAEPQLDLAGVSYVDTCACSDRDTCFYHRMHLDEASPKRPTTEALTERGLARLKNKFLEYDEKKDRFEAYKTVSEENGRLKADVVRLTEALDKEKQVTQHLIDSACHYRNLAIVLGAKPEQMMGTFDRTLCEQGLDPDETSGGYHISINQQLAELKDTWDEIELLKADRERLQERVSRLEDLLNTFRDATRDAAALLGSD